MKNEVLAGLPLLWLFYVLIIDSQKGNLIAIPVMMTFDR